MTRVGVRKLGEIEGLPLYFPKFTNPDLTALLEQSRMG